MEIIDRKSAAALGLKHYFTGKPCGRGHTVHRYTNTGACVSCIREYANRYRVTGSTKLPSQFQKEEDYTFTITAKERDYMRAMEIALWETRRNPSLKLFIRSFSGKHAQTLASVFTSLELDK